MFLTIIPQVKNISAILPLASVAALLAVMLLPILVVQELTNRISHSYLQALRQVLNLAATPLILGFLIAVGLRIYLILERYYQYNASLP